mmetsp:Transcript_64970/g.146533  ORF Transcript_64970/g.146533 Transcript_64970/m.146533 type:complete len:186 (+) Transcript_64970:2-559(+)
MTTAKEGVEIAAQISDALNYMHGCGIIHLDLTSSNVLLTRSNSLRGYSVKVGDFGLSLVLEWGKTKVSSQFTGTVSFMPPELLLKVGKHLTKAVDVYSFGVILWQLCTFEVPFAGLSPVQIVVQLARGETLTLPGGSPIRLANMCRRCMARAPNERPVFSELIEELLGECDSWSARVEGAPGSGL